MAFLDEAHGISIHMSRPDKSFFTAGFDCQFIGGSVVGELIVAETEVVSATRSLMFMRGLCKVDDRIITSASGIWKKVGDRSPLDRQYQLFTNSQREVPRGWNASSAEMVSITSK